MREQTIEDKTFGTLIWDDSLEWWEGKREIAPGHFVSIAVSPGDKPSETVLEQARQSLKHLQSEDLAFRRFAADTLLALHNEEWNDGPPTDGETFAGRMTLTEFAAYEDGRAEISYDDGDLFWGHTIFVSVDANGAFQDAGING